MLIKRTIYNKIIEHLDKPEATLIVGARQIGKTTIIKEVEKKLKAQGEKTVYLNLDIEDDFQHFESQQHLIQYLQLYIGKEKGYVFIDEIQRKENAGIFFKGILDLKLPYKFILTGSGSVELKEKIAESLAGRKQVFTMNTVSFIEFLHFKTDYKHEEQIELFLQTEKKLINEIFEEYIKFGGYPKVILADTLEEKRDYIQEIYSSYIEKDIVGLLKVTKSDIFSKLVTLLASQIGNKINITELSNTLNIDAETVSKYLWYLEKTFILNPCRPFFTNTRSELTKSPVFYFTDLGLCNYSLHRFTNFNTLLQGGHLFENFVYNFLKDNFTDFNPNINYWRTKDGAEVDFVLRFGEILIPIEVKYSKFNLPKYGKSFINFLVKYKPKKGYIINLNLDHKVQKEGAEIKFLGISNLLTEKFI